MIRTRVRKVLRDVWARKGRTALVSISIMIGVFGVVTLIGAGDIIIRQLKEDIAAEELPMLRVYLTNDADATAETALAPDVMAPLVNPVAFGYDNASTPTHVEAQAIYPLNWRLPNSDVLRDDFIFAYDRPFEEIQLEPMRLLDEGDGRWPAPGANEVAIEQRVADKFDLSVGDTVTFRILSEATGELDADGRAVIPEEDFVVTGLVFHPYQAFSRNGQQIQQNRAFYASLETTQRITDLTGYSSVYIRWPSYDTVEDETTVFEGIIAEATPYGSFLFFREDPDNAQIITTSEQFVQVIYVLALVAVTVAGFLVTNVINTIVVEQRTQIGVMKSLGATRLDNGLMYGGIALAYGVIGMIPGVLLGIPAAWQIGVVLGSAANAYVEGFAFSTLGVAMGVLMGLLVPLVASIVPVYNGTRVTILESMTDLGIWGQYGGGPIARLIAALPVPINVKQALANISLKKLRLTLTVVTMTFAVAAFMGISALFLSINNTVEELFDAFNFTIQIIPDNRVDYAATEQLLLDNVDGAEQVFPGVFLAVGMDEYTDDQFGFDQVFILGFDGENNIIRPSLNEGRMFSNDPTANEIVVTQVLSDAIDKGVGDWVEVRIAGRSEAFEIVGVDGLVPFAQSYMNWERAAVLGDLTAGSEVQPTLLPFERVPGYQDGLPSDEGYVLALPATDFGQLALLLQADTSAADHPVFVSEAMASALPTATFTVNGAAAPIDYAVTGVVTGNVLQQIVALVGAALPQSAEVLVAENNVVIMRYDDLVAIEGRAVDRAGQAAPNVMFIQLTDPNPTVLAADEVMADTKEILLANGITASYENQEQTNEDIATGVLSLGVLFNATSLVMALVGSIGLLTTLFMAVFERQKEIGVMRSVGATSGTIVSQFLVEGVAVGVIAFVLAAPLSYVLATGLATLLPFGDVFAFSYPLPILLVGLVGTLIIAALASILPSLSAANRTVSDILRYQ